MLHIWFNRTYATTVHTIGLLRDNPDDAPVRIIGTHADRSSPVLTACDVVEDEPDEQVVGESYIEWALDLCVRHQVDVFVPRLHMDEITEARHRFASAGVSLVAGPSGPVRLLADKAAAYADAAAAGLAVPPYRVIRDAAAFTSAVEYLTQDGVALCLKPTVGTGAEGFRVLTTTRPRLAEITGRSGVQVHIDDVASALELHAATGADVAPLMVMPLLPGPEVSVDCLGDSDGSLLAAVPRVKNGRRRQLVDDPAAIDVARTIVRRHSLSSLSNTQVRYWAQPGHDAVPRPYLLETNTRMSGGLYQTALSGLNLPWAAVQQALGNTPRLPPARLGVEYTTVSSLVAL